LENKKKGLHLSVQRGHLIRNGEHRDDVCHNHEVRRVEKPGQSVSESQLPYEIVNLLLNIINNNHKLTKHLGHSTVSLWMPLSSEYGTYKTVMSGIWTWRSGDTP
jgi:hypothetical protein